MKMNSEVMTAKPMLKPTLDPIPFRSKMSKAGEQFLNWVCAHYKIIVDALDEGERVHQLIQERKNEDQLKAIRNGILYRFY
jgi:hypothetical protein